GELAKERDVVIQEIGEAADVPDDAVMEMLQTLAFGGHALGRPVLGTVESVAGHSSERLRAFMSKHYVATTLIVAASGAIDPDELAALAKDRFGARPAAPPRLRAPQPCYVGGAMHDPRDIEQTHVALAFPGSAAVDPDYFATRVFVEALGGGMSSRIFQSVREERGLAYSVYSFTDSYDDIGTVGAYVGADAESAPEAVGIIRDEIEAMAAGATVEEVDRARALLKSSMLMALESPSARTETAVGQLYAHGRLLPTEELKARLDAVTVEDVRKAAAKALSGAPSLAIVGAAEFAGVRKALAAGAH
ncbi:MAG: insulinase family protein, partial [Parvularculaceae bacterium]|nr:insulinase family protein [Parvularculaceae bacterium]